MLETIISPAGWGSPFALGFFLVCIGILLVCLGAFLWFISKANLPK